MNSDWQALLTQLSQPFDPKEIKWRAGATTRDKKKAQALPYAEPRAYEDRLNEICPEGWQVEFTPWGESRIICRLTIHGVTRASTGESGNSKEDIAGTAAEAQAFKRACSKFGLGRYLYDLPVPWVEYDAEKKRLLEVPSLPSRPAKPAKPAPETLSRERAAAMHRELSTLGLNREEHYAAAEATLHREVKSLTTLTEAEALEVWRAAKRETHHQAHPVSDAEAAAVLG